jgi:hypothetical protein
MWRRGRFSVSISCPSAFLDEQSALCGLASTSKRAPPEIQTVSPPSMIISLPVMKLVAREEQYACGDIRRVGHAIDGVAARPHLFGFVHASARSGARTDRPCQSPIEARANSSEAA